MYSIVIPVYNDFDNLDLLLKDISVKCVRHRPETIILVDDGSTEKLSEWFRFKKNSYSLPIVKTLRIPQSGPAYAVSVGLSKVETPYCFVIDSDVRLEVNTKSCKHDDPLSVCYWHGEGIEDLSAIGCYLVDSYREDLSYHSVVSKGPLVLTSEEKNYRIVETHYNFKVDSIINLALTPVEIVFSLPSSFYMLNMNLFKTLGGFDDTFAPYGFYLSDYLARGREKKHQTYLTYETLVFHKKKPKKQKGTKAIYTEISAQEFHKKWDGNPAWQSNALYKENILKEVSASDDFNI